MNLGLQRKTDLALMAIAVLARSDGLVNGADLAERLETTATFLPQVMSPLVKAGWVTSERGPRGGYRLSPAGAEVSLLDIIEENEGPTRSGRCVLRQGECPGEVLCPIHDVWIEARRVLMEGLAGMTARNTQWNALTGSET
jgi:Rrf2 family protein